jgi:hypothetical protein
MRQRKISLVSGAMMRENDSLPEFARLAVVPTLALRDTELSPSAFRLLVAMACFASRDGWCWPTYQQLADMLGISRRRVIDLMATLIARGWVRAVAQRGGDGRQCRNRYLVVLDHDPTAETIEAFEAAPPEPDVDDIGEGRGEENFTGGVKETSPGGEARGSPGEGEARGSPPKLHSSKLHPLTPRGNTRADARCADQEGKDQPSASKPRRKVSQVAQAQPELIPAPQGSDAAPRRPAAAASSPARGKGARSRLPADWTPSPEQVQHAYSLGVTPADLSAIVGRFRAYWCDKPGSAGVKASWDQTWRNWIEADAHNLRFRRSGGGRGQPMPIAVPASDGDPILDAYLDLLLDAVHEAIVADPDLRATKPQIAGRTPQQRLADMVAWLRRNDIPVPTPPAQVRAALDAARAAAQATAGGAHGA